MTPAARWALIAGVLVLAGVIAALPLLRTSEPGESGATATAEELAAARERAELRPCPAGKPDVAPVVSLRGIRAMCLGDGEQVDVGRALAGGETLLNVWATWCAPCREELVVLEEYATSPGAVDVLAVQVESPVAGGLSMLDELGVRLPSLHDGDGRGRVRSALRAPKILPASYLVTADGEIRFIENPRVFSGVDQVRKAVSRYGGSS